MKVLSRIAVKRDEMLATAQRQGRDGEGLVAKRKSDEGLTVKLEVQ